MKDSPIAVSKERELGWKFQFEWKGKGVTDTRQLSEESEHLN